ncbi:hypothetical protein LEMLEM_LOCUS27177 [Lemmus lemmus]
MYTFCGVVWLTLGRWASGPCKPTRPHVILHLCSENHAERNSVLAQLWFCFPRLHLILPLPRWSVSFLPAVGLRDGRASRRSCSLSSCSLPQRSWSCWSDTEFDNQRIHPRQGIIRLKSPREALTDEKQLCPQPNPLACVNLKPGAKETQLDWGKQHLEDT